MRGEETLARGGREIIAESDRQTRTVPTSGVSFTFPTLWCYLSGMGAVPTLTRRGFLRATTFSAAMLAVSRLRPNAVAAADAAEAPGELRVLSARQAEILTAIGARIAATGEPSMPEFGDTPAIATIDRTLLYLPADIRDQFGWALLLFDYGPFVFDLRFSRFTALGPEERDASIRGWAGSRFETRRLVYRAMKNMSFLGYYSQDATWAGIHYGGPWLPRPRREPPPEDKIG